MKSCFAVMGKTIGKSMDEMFIKTGKAKVIRFSALEVVCKALDDDIWNL